MSPSRQETDQKYCSRWRRRVASTAVAVGAFYVIAMYKPVTPGMEVPIEWGFSSTTSTYPATHELGVYLVSNHTIPKLPATHVSRINAQQLTIFFPKEKSA